MVFELKARPIQTRIKHEILRRYLAAWAGIILNGLGKHAARRNDPLNARFIYFDGFAYAGRYLPDQGSDRSFEVGSPIIGIEELDKAANVSSARSVNLTVVSLLVEEERENYLALECTLNALGYRDRLRGPNSLAEPKHGDIILLNADATSLRCELQHLQAKDTWLFGFLDPYGGSGLPYEFVQGLASRPRTDLLINWPFYDLAKKAGLITKFDLSNSDQALLANYARMFPNNDWLTRYGEAKASEDREATLVGCYHDALRAMDKGLTAKFLRMPFPDAERAMYYLFLTTHNPDGALIANQVLYEAGHKQEALRQYLKTETSVTRKGMRALFDLHEYDPPPRRETRDVDTARLAEDIARSFAGKAVALRDVKKAYSEDTDLYDVDIKKALTALKKQGRATWDGDLQNQTAVRFTQVR